MTNIELLVEGFGALKHVTNLYALYGFVFLIIIIAIGVFMKNQKIKGALLFFACISALYGSYSLLKHTVTDIENSVMLHLVRDGSRVEISPDITIELIDIETLQGKNGWEFNSSLNDREHIFHEVFLRAKADLNKLRDMDEQKWNSYLTDLESFDGKKADNDKKIKISDKKLESKIIAKKIKDIPFAKYRVIINGKPDTAFSSRYFFKGEVFCIPYALSNCKKAKISIENIYNTKHYSSGEAESSNIRVIRSD